MRISCLLDSKKFLLCSRYTKCAYLYHNLSYKVFTECLTKFLHWYLMLLLFEVCTKIVLFCFVFCICITLQVLVINERFQCPATNMTTNNNVVVISRNKLYERSSQIGNFSCILLLGKSWFMQRKICLEYFKKISKTF